MARNDSSLLDVIHAPNNPGVSSQYEEKGIKLLNGTFSTLGLPNFAPYSYFRNNSPVLFLGNDTLICNGETLPLKINLTTSCGAFSYLWSNGSNESEIVVSQPGVYWVEITNACATFRDSIHVSFAACQPACNQTSGIILGSATEVQRGYSLAPAMDNKSFYVAGLKNDSITITKMALNGVVEWFRILDLAMGLAAHISTVILDSEGNLILAGNLGGFPFANSTFVIKYNPDLNTILWSKSYTLTPGSTHFALTQMDPGGNYLISITTNYSNTDNANLIELDNTTGEPVSPIFVEYHLGASEGLSELVYHEGFIYGIGRYTDGFSPADMRSTIVKLNGTDASQVWVRLGHIASNSTARLYGADLVIYEDNIYSVYFGDPSGTSLVNNTLYLQRTNLDGELIWLKSYSLPGTTGDAGVEIIRSDDGFIVLAKERSSASSLVLFKVDENGNIFWARTYTSPDFISVFGDLENGRTSQLIQVDDNLIFAGFGNNQTGGSNMIVVIADLEGEVEEGCISSSQIAITVSTVSNPVFYSVSPTFMSVPPQVSELAINVNNSVQQFVCTQVDTLVESISVFICQGESFEGYTTSGVYIDTLINDEGCDSVRTLELTVISPEKYLNLTLCNGEKFEQYYQSGIYTDTLGGFSGDCDTVRYLDLTIIPGTETFIDVSICEGQIYLGYNTTGLYIDTLEAVNGCDSIRILQLNVETEIFANETKSICLGDTYRGYATSGIYIDTFQASFGCDSIVRLDLSIEPDVKTLDVEICNGERFENYLLPGFYVDTIHGIATPCDTIRQLTLIVNQIQETSYHKSLCTGEFYEGYLAPGTYIDTLVTSKGCDSIRTLELTELDLNYSHITKSVCEGSLLGYSKAGVYIDTLISSVGCDTIRTLVLEAGSKFIPNVFSPNGDGINDIFSVSQSSDQAFGLQYFGLFDRYGDMVYQATSWPVNWDGNNRSGIPYQSGVFSFVFIYTCGINTIIEHGNVTLLR